MRYSPVYPSPVNIKCELCEHDTTTGICAFCAEGLCQEGKLTAFEMARDEEIAKCRADSVLATEKQGP